MQSVRVRRARRALYVNRAKERANSTRSCDRGASAPTRCLAQSTKSNSIAWLSPSPVFTDNARSLCDTHHIRRGSSQLLATHFERAWNVQGGAGNVVGI